MKVRKSVAQQRKRKREHDEPHQEGKNHDRTGAGGRGHAAAAAGQAGRLDTTDHGVPTRNRSAAGRARGGPARLNSLIYQRN